MPNKVSLLAEYFPSIKCPQPRPLASFGSFTRVGVSSSFAMTVLFVSTAIFMLLGMSTINMGLFRGCERTTTPILTLREITK